MAELTARALEVLKLVARGLSNRQIGKSLFLERRQSRRSRRTSTPSWACASASNPGFSPTKPGSCVPETRKPGRWHIPGQQRVRTSGAAQLRFRVRVRRSPKPGRWAKPQSRSSTAPARSVRRPCPSREPRGGALARCGDPQRNGAEATLCGGLAWSRQSREALRSLSERTTCERLVRPGADDPNRWTKGVRVAGQLGLLLVVPSGRLAGASRDACISRRVAARGARGLRGARAAAAVRRRSGG